MKNLKLLLTLFIIGTVSFACGDDDDNDTSTLTGSNGDGASSELVGTWNAFEFVNDDGAIYQLNQDIPAFDTINGCQVIEYRTKYSKATVTFGADSSYNLDVVFTDSERTFTINDTSNCDITYGQWVSNNQDSFQEIAKYYTISSTQFVTISQDSVFDFSGNFLYIEDYRDTSNYSISGGVLNFADGFVRMRK